MLTICVNGQIENLPGSVNTIRAALDIWQPNEPYAVALNDVFVPRSLYTEMPLSSGDNVDILSPITGG